MSNIQIINADCMEAMKQMPDKAFQLAICDPPYGIEKEISIGGGSHTKAQVKFHHLYSEQGKHWDKRPPQQYFDELFRVTNNQIIWGGNYFSLGETRGFIVWDKKQMMPNFSRCEFAWTSFKRPSQIAEISYFGNINVDTWGRIHPTQKPVALYQWLLKNYAKPGDKILDTHGGSCSIAIACDIMGFDATIYEIDEDYYKAAVERFQAHKRQMPLELPAKPEYEQVSCL